MVIFQALTWEPRDDDEDEDERRHLISIFGKTGDGRSVCVTTSFQPYLFVRMPNASKATGVEIFTKLNKLCPDCLTGYGFLMNKDVWGFQNNERVPFMKLDCVDLEARRMVDYTLRRPLELSMGFTTLRVYESNLDPVLRLMHRTNVMSTGWLEIDEDKCVKSSIATTDVDLFCQDWKLLKPVEKDDMAPFVVASLDIESYSSTGKFPDADVRDDCCFQIAITLCEFGSDEPYDKTILCYKKADPDLEGVHVLSYATEREMLEAFQKYLVEKDVDIITGWNIFGFDLEYIFKRALICGCSLQTFHMSKLRDHRCELKHKKLSSSALGDNVLKLLPMPGRFIFDLFHEVKKNYKLDSYKLDNVSKLYLGDQKIDMPAREMFRRFEREDPVELREVAEYCVKDTLLPHRLMKKLCTLLNMMEMAKACWTPLQYLCERGQQIKVFSQLTKKARELGFMVPVIRKNKNALDEGYEGATVLEAQKGAYYTPITALDFASLYPSIMMAHNMCYSTLVLDERKYGNIPGVEYETFELASGKKYKFAQNVASLLPEILSELKVFRKKAKQDMAMAQGFMKEVFNGKQLAFKISMNSVYGFTGASSGMLPCVAIASSVTFKGRSMIEETKNYVEKHFPGAKVRYGDTDSVMVEFDVQGRTGQDAIDFSWKLGEEAAEQCTKLFKKPNDLELEKVYMPYFLYSKKRYAAKLWEKSKSGKVEFKYVDVKGLQLVRRDNTPHVREVCKELLDVVLESSDPKPAIELARERGLELLTGDVPTDKLILSQTLSDTYKVSGEPVSVNDERRCWEISMSHVQVRNKMRERRPGSEPQTGDRVPFVLTQTGDHRASAFQKAEDPQYVKENNIPIDYWYYFDNKFSQPVADLLEPLVGDKPKLAIFGDIITQHKPVTKKKSNGPPLSGMKKADLILECQRLQIDDTGKVDELKARIKAARQEETAEDLFKNYTQSFGKDDGTHGHQTPSVGDDRTRGGAEGEGTSGGGDPTDE